jgi:hypothetical protein
MQRALLQWKRPQNKRLVLEALREAGREDLIGYGRHCLVRPERPAGEQARTRPAGEQARTRPAGKKSTEKKPVGKKAAGRRRQGRASEITGKMPKKK